MSDSDIQTQIEALDRQVDLLKSAIANARRLRLFIVLAGVTMLVVTIFLFVDLGKRVSSEEFLTEVQAEAQKELNNNQDRYLGVLQGVVDDTAPVIWKAFYEQSKKDAPKYSLAFNRERDVFSSNMQTAIDERVNQRYLEILKGHEAIIAEEFPQLADEERRENLIAAMEVALSKLVKEYYVDKFESRIAETYSTWDSFPAADVPNEDESQLEDRLMEIFTEVVTMVITQLNSSPAAS